MSSCRGALLASSLVIVMAACGGSGGGSDGADGAPSTTAESTATTEWPYTIDDYVAVVGGGSDFTASFAPEEADCFVRRYTEGIGLDRLAEAGVTPEGYAELDEDELVSYREGRRITVDALVECLDFHELVISQSDLSDGDAACLRDEVEERWLAESLLGTTDGDVESTPEGSEAYASAVAACPEAMAALA